MELKNTNSEIFIPESNIDKALERTTYMAIGAHHDDIELMSYDAIQKCFESTDEYFTGVVVTDGSGSPRNGFYNNYSEDDMKKIRKLEQKKAALIGNYGAQIMLGYTSSEVKNPCFKDVTDDIETVIKNCKPSIIYTHNLADKHNTHIAVALKVIKALRNIPIEERPEKLYGCEIWRSLDWVNDDEKVMLDVSQRPNLASALIGVFDSQICGGKRYDLAIIGRHHANATFSDYQSVDKTNAITFALDMTCLIHDENIDVLEYINGYIDRFKSSVGKKISSFL